MARLSQEKQQKLLAFLDSFAKRRKCTKRELLSLIGSLSFATKVVAPGQTFLSRIIKQRCTVSSLNHLVYLNQSVREDIHMWHTFISQWNGKSFFLYRYLTEAPDLQLFTDASGALGYGAYFQGHWFRGDWAPEQALNPVTVISISWQELYVIVLAALFFCDNEAAVQAINSGTAKCPHMASLIRTLVLQSMKCNFFIHAEHIPGVSNGIADSLSHNQLQRFRTLAPHADLHPPRYQRRFTTVCQPGHILPSSCIQQCYPTCV